MWYWMVQIGCRITNQWIYWKELWTWIYYFLKNKFLSEARFLIFWVFRPSASPLSHFDTIILVRTPNHILGILAKNRKIQCEIEYMVFSTVSKWRIVVGMPNGWCHWHVQLGFDHWVLDGWLWPKTFGFCDLLCNRYAPVSKIPFVKGNSKSKRKHFVWESSSSMEKQEEEFPRHQRILSYAEILNQIDESG